MSPRIEFSAEASTDLIDLYDTIADRAGEDRAMGYVERIEIFCRGLSTFPDRGIRRDDLRPDLRVLGFERRVLIAYHVTADAVTILRVFYGGQDTDAAFGVSDSRRP